MIFEAWKDTIHNENVACKILTDSIKRANQRAAFGMIRSAAFN